MTDVPGTTRDHIEVPLALSGVPIRLTDTAGLRESGELVEQIGVERARRLVELADVLLWLGEADEAPEHPRLVRVHSKADLPGRGNAPSGSIAVSALTGRGLDGLVEAIATHARTLLPAESEVALNRRQWDCIAEAREALAAASGSADLVIVAEALRSARASFDRLTGRAGVEDLLDALFSRFCLGK